MIFETTSIPCVIKIHPDVHKDNRGYFFESFKKNEFEKKNLNMKFVQDNQAQSSKGVLRGLHYQLNNPQGKLVWVTLGKVFDVAVDIRIGSPTFGQSITTLLDDKSHLRFYVPPGFAHGYHVLSENAIFNYKCTDYYHPEDEHGVKWNDPSINIEWVKGDKIISQKDSNFLNLNKIDEALLPTYSEKP